MALKTAAGTKVYIGPANGASPPNNITALAALSWTEIGLVETTPEYGDESASVTFTSLGDGRVRKGKGARDAGSMALTVGNDPADPGQSALVAAEATQFTYPFRIVYPDRLTSGGTDSEEFFHGLVRSKRRTGGDVNSILRRTFNVDIDSQVWEKPAT